MTAPKPEPEQTTTVTARLPINVQEVLHHNGGVSRMLRAIAAIYATPILERAKGGSCQVDGCPHRARDGYAYCGAHGLYE